ncbi:MAG: hypothetical protein ABIK98_14205 [Pseudomonadota bacterium]|uniref:DUF5666 domain-containing protein n=1 Tax=Candidatus Desulfatibia profunda TaxID=2841695 RepID=A0A8J6NRN5_9BACT|nr:hypothetical protein [Candidatus Desulfatibia profunda]MBL7179483.1 hypothetical protein [Desulfobacterales bacterium]
MKKLAILMSVLMLITLTAGISMAKEKKAPAPAKLESLSGEVVKVDAAKGEIVIKADGKDQTLKAEPKLLEGIAAGQKVSIEKSETTLKSIKKVEAPAAPAAAPAKK